MAYTLIVHISNAEPIVGETENLPSPNDTMVVIQNPRKLDGKDLPYLAENVQTVYWPIQHINFIEVISEGEAEAIIGFVRE